MGFTFISLLHDVTKFYFQYSSTIVTGPVISSPINKKPRSGFDVFDFDSERTDDMYRMKCTAEHYTCIKVNMGVRSWECD